MPEGLQHAQTMPATAGGGGAKSSKPAGGKKAAAQEGGAWQTATFVYKGSLCALTALCALGVVVVGIIGFISNFYKPAASGSADFKEWFGFFNPINGLPCAGIVQGVNDITRGLLGFLVLLNELGCLKHRAEPVELRDRATLAHSSILVFSITVIFCCSAQGRLADTFALRFHYPTGSRG